MELVLACFAWLVGQCLVRRTNDRVANRTLGAFIALELGLSILLKEAQRVENKPILTAKQLLHSEEPCAPLCFTHSHALDIADLDTV